MNAAASEIQCIGCGARVPDIVGPTHAYIGASPGCWRIYGDVLALEYGAYAYPECHRLTVDAYAVQHPGVPSRRSIQSVAVHLISLHLVIERGLTSARATESMRVVLRHEPPFVWLDPPPTIGEVTILDVAASRDLEAHEREVRRWAESVWRAWSAHHPAIRAWANASAT